jgi:hypothetical protein
MKINVGITIFLDRFGSGKDTRNDIILLGVVPIVNGVFSHHTDINVSCFTSHLGTRRIVCLQS